MHVHAHIQGETKFVHKLFIVSFFVKKQVQIIA
jgi:hypothetical protein